MAGLTATLARWRGALRVTAALVLCAGCALADAAAQCALCAQSAQNAGSPETVARTFATAIAILLVPVVGMLGGAGYLLWRFREGGTLRPGSPHPPEVGARPTDQAARPAVVLRLRRRG